MLGEHDGIERFTIGQRKGLGVAAGRKRFVLEIVPETNDGRRRRPGGPARGGLVASRVNWLIDAPTEPLRVHGEDPLPARGRPGDRDRTPDGAAVRFDAPQPAVTPGQAVAFYAGTRVLGGGWIEQATK